MSVRLQFRRGTEAEWFAADTVLGEAEIGYETDTKKIKVGNGLTSWNSLAYVNVVPSDLVNTLNDYVLVGDVGNAGGPAKLDSNGNLLIPKSSIILEGSLANDYETTLTVANPTADRTILFRDQSGTVALLSDIDDLVGGAPGALNTLNELAAALGDDENYAATITTSLGVIIQGGIDHTSSTTSVHGIDNTANLATKTYADTASGSAANAAVGTHNTDSTNVHGIVDTADLMLKSGATMTGDLTLNGDPDYDMQASTKKYVDDHVDTHNATEENVHGIADTAALATKTYADNTATTIATTISTNAINLLTTSDIEEGTNLYFTSTRANNQAKNMMSAGDNEVVTDSLEVSTNDFNVGSAAKGLRTTDDYTNPIAVFSTAASDYAQVVIKNTTNAPNSSTDLILYPSNGTDTSGYIDIGITSPTFSDPDFTITSGNDGYIFMEAPVGTAGNGNLVLATGANGEHNHIVFAAGGLQSNNTQMTIFPDERVHIEIDSPSTSPTTGALTVVGGVGIQGDLNIQGDVDIEGTIVFGGAGTTVETANLSVTDPLIFVGKDNTADIVDLGIIGEYLVGTNKKYSGIVRDASDGTIKTFKGASTKPTSTINFAESGLEYADLQIAALNASSITVGDISNTEFGYLNGVTSAIQDQLDDKAPIDAPTFTGLVTVAASGVAFADGTQTKEGVPSRTPIILKTEGYKLSSLSERDSLIEINSETAVTLTIPKNSDVAFPIGTTLDILQTGAGTVTIAGEVVSGVPVVTVNATPGKKLRTQWSSCTLFKRGENSWVVYGDLKE
jgi:cytoskeletal protein CcmA (bactofilin family)